MTVKLENVEEPHRANPQTYSIPRAIQRNNLQIGEYVKLVFLVDIVGEIRAERMWVEVSNVDDSQYIGILRNEPIHITYIGPGDFVTFLSEHVAAIYRDESMPQVPYGKYALVDKQVHSGKQWPMRLVRKNSVEESFSGWWIFSGNESESELKNANKLIPCLIEEIVSQFQVLDSVLDEPPGTSWIWNEKEVEYQQDK